MITTITITVVLTIAVLLAFVSTRPGTFHVARSAGVNAPPDKVYALINDLHHWTGWSPWEKLDPAMKKSYSGPATGVGAATAWEGNNKVGVGRMEIIESMPASKVAIRLDFLKPFEAHNTAEFTLNAQDGVTTVTWTMFGPANFMTKLMGCFYSMDRMVGGDFERGLASLKALAEQ